MVNLNNDNNTLITPIKAETVHQKSQSVVVETEKHKEGINNLMISENKELISSPEPQKKIYIDIASSTITNSNIQEEAKLNNESVSKAEVLNPKHPKVDEPQTTQFAYNLDELSDIIIAHHQLMEYWIAQLPDKIFTLKYEALIDNQETISRQLLDFLGLDWQAKCLTFYQTDRAVHTITNSQIRQPLFTHAKQYWLRYQTQLQPYANKLQQAGLRF